MAAGADLVGPSKNLPTTEAPEARPHREQFPDVLSMGNPCLDFFFHIVPDTPPQAIADRQLAWRHNPLTALKLVCNLRGVKGTGKSDRKGFYAAVLWLHQHHPKTLAGNVAAFAGFDYFKDLLKILFRILEGSDARKSAKWVGKKWKSWRKLGRKRKSVDFRRHFGDEAFSDSTANSRSSSSIGEKPASAAVGDGSRSRI